MTPDDPELRAEALRFAQASRREFTASGDGRYLFSLRDAGIVFDLDRVRRERHELIGELTVRCDLPGSLIVGVDASLTTADFNLSSLAARQARAKLLSQRSKAPELDWFGLLESFCQQVMASERTGNPAVQLRDLARPEPNRELDIHGWRIPSDHPSIGFGDGGALKSYLALYAGGTIAQTGLRVMFADWELDGDEHRDRLERLFGADMPELFYLRCDRPLVAEVDRLRRVRRDKRIDFTIYDSIAFACDGPPESAEVAGAYFRAARSIGGGSLHLAHINKSENGEQKPFGSAFWFNGARAIWFAKRSGQSPDGRTVSIGLFNRKSNLGPILPGLAFEFTFGSTQTHVRRVDATTIPDFADKLSLSQRIKGALAGGPLTIPELATELDAKLDTVIKAVNRWDGRTLTRVVGIDGKQRISLVERMPA